jgi:sterol 3beta-glucosyltransferase
VRVALLTHGTRGDVQPLCALADGLRARGHAPMLAVPPNLVAFAARLGVDAAPLEVDSRAALAAADADVGLAAGNVPGVFAALRAVTTADGDALCDRAIAACDGADAVIATMLMDDVGAAIAEARKLPLMLAYTIPITPTRAWASPFFAATPPSGALRLETHARFAREAWALRGGLIARLRSRLGVAPVDGPISARLHAAGTPVLHAWSPHVLPRPGDWGDAHAVTGYWQLPPALRARLADTEGPREDLTAWLAAGPAPLYFGFGSMPLREPAALLATVLAVCGELGVRALICAGANDLAPLRRGLAPDAFLLDAVDHAWLFPRCAGVLHHGGAGTTAAALHAGVPTLVCSLFADQPFWGARVSQLGVGAHLPFAALRDTRRLRAALAHIARDEVRARSAALASALAREDGVASALDVIDARLGTAPVPTPTPG